MGWHGPDGSGRGSGGRSRILGGARPAVEDRSAAQRRGWRGVRRSRSMGVKGAAGAAGSSSLEQRQTPKPGSPRRLGGVTGATSSTGTRCGRPACRSGRRSPFARLRGLMFRWCWVRQPVMRLSRPERVRQQRVGGPGRARWRSRCHPTTPARRHMKYEGFVKKCQARSPIWNDVAVTTVSGGYDSARTWNLDE